MVYLPADEKGEGLLRLFHL